MEKNIQAIIYFVRHADFDNSKTIMPGRLPVPLSEKGKAQSIKLKKFFRDKKIARIYSSSVERCKETSVIIADDRIPIMFDTRLLETLSAYQGYWGDDRKAFYSFREELGGETNKNIQDRMIAFWKYVIDRSEGNIVVCSHGDPLDFLYEYLVKEPLDAEPKPFAAWPETDHYQPKASIRPIALFSDGTYKIDKIILNEDLSAS